MEYAPSLSDFLNIYVVGIICKRMGFDYKIKGLLTIILCLLPLT